MMNAYRWAPVLASALTALHGGSAALVAQTEGPARVAVIGALAETRRMAAGDVVRLDGFLFGGEGAIGWGRVRLRARLAAGALDPVSPAGVGSAGGSTYAQARALVSVAPVPGLELGTGVDAHSYFTGLNDGDSDRWMSWVLDARYGAPIVGTAVRGFIEGWGSLLGHGAGTGPFDNGWGGAAGIGICPGGASVGLWLDYSIEESSFGSGARHETVETVSLAVGYGCR